MTTRCGHIARHFAKTESVKIAVADSCRPPHYLNISLTRYLIPPFIPEII
jgi:hypothetical protein